MTNESDKQRRLDEELLIDFLMGACSADQASEVQRRLAEDKAFGELRANLANALGAMDLDEAPAIPDDLAGRTMDRIASQHRLDALLADEARSARRGWSFSLREALSVAAAIVLLFSAFVPSIVRTRQRVQVGLGGARVGQIGQANAMFARDNNNYLPSAADDNRRWMPTNGEPFSTNSGGLFLLIRQGYARPEQFICPAVKTPTHPVEVRAGMVDFPSAANISFSYQHSIGGRRILLDDKQLAHVKDTMAILADSNPVFEKGRFDREQVGNASMNHSGRGQNVLYMDMHVQWQQTPAVGVAGDDIYLAGENDADYQGDESPANVTDTFLLPAHAKSAD